MAFPVTDDRQWLVRCFEVLDVDGRAVDLPCFDRVLEGLDARRPDDRCVDGAGTVADRDRSTPAGDRTQWIYTPPANRRAMLESIPVGRLLAEFGLGAVAGGVLGYATSKMARLLAVVLAVQLALFRFLESRGIVVVHYDRLTAGLVDARNAVEDPGWIVPVLSTAAIALGFGIGFAIMFQRA